MYSMMTRLTQKRNAGCMIAILIFVALATSILNLIGVNHIYTIRYAADQHMFRGRRYYNSISRRFNEFKVKVTLVDGDTEPNLENTLKCWPELFQIEKFSILNLEKALENDLINIIAVNSKNIKQKNLIQAISAFVYRGGGLVGFAEGARCVLDKRITAFRANIDDLGWGVFLNPEINQNHSSANDWSELENHTQSFYYANGPFAFELNEQTLKSGVIHSPEHIVSVSNSIPRFKNLKSSTRRSSCSSFKCGLKGKSIVVSNGYGRGQVVLSSIKPQVTAKGFDYSFWMPKMIQSKCNSNEALLIKNMFFAALGRE